MHKIFSDRELREHRRVARKRWADAHPNYHSDWKKKNRLKVNAWGRESQRVNRVAWHRWLRKNGYTIPSLKAPYHHPYPESKLFTIGQFIGKFAVNPRNIKRLRDELKKCWHVKASRHHQLHWILQKKTQS